MQVGIWQLVLILIVVLIIFGAGRLPKVMGDMAKGVKTFKDEMDAPAPKKIAPKKKKTGKKKG